MKRILIFVFLIWLIVSLVACKSSSPITTPIVDRQETSSVITSNATVTPLATDIPIAISPTPTTTSSPIPPTPTTTPDGRSWQEVGEHSASGGGISNSGMGTSSSLAIAPDGSIYVVWHDYSGGITTPYIYIKVWNGSNWSEIGEASASGTGISNSNVFPISGPSLAISPAGLPYVAWVSIVSGNSEIYVRAWNGSEWAEVGTGSASGGGISNTAELSMSPSLAIAPDGTPYIAWQDGIGGNEIYVRAWNGSEWVEVGTGSASGGGISNTVGASWAPSIVIAPNGTPFVAWMDINGDNTEIYIRSWNGVSWAEVGESSADGGGISNSAGMSGSPSLAIASDGMLYIAWTENPKGDEAEIYILKWDGLSWMELGTGSASKGGISDNYGDSGSPSLAIAPDNTLYIAWEDTSINGTFEDYEIYILVWNGSSWGEVGISSANEEGISHANGSKSPSLAIAPDGTPYVAWDYFTGMVGDIYIRQFTE